MNVALGVVILVFGVGGYLWYLRSKSSNPRPRSVDKIVAEAEFHIAYKLYRGALIVVDQGLQAHPANERLLALRRRIKDLEASSAGNREL
jgi:hypothetical protein